MVFPGQGAQWPGMGLRLWDTVPAFGQAMDECAELLEPVTGWRLRQVLADPEELSRVDVVQPASFAVAVSLAALWAAVGVTPDAVAGHSQGEIAAAYVAGVLTLEDALTVVVGRSRALAGLDGTGGMVAVAGATPEAVDARVDASGRLALAAVNGPTSTVVSGEAAALDAFVAAAERDGLRVRRIPVGYGSHSAHVEPIASAVRSALAGIRARPATVPMWSTTYGRWVEGPELDADYWWRNLRLPVGFAAAVPALPGCIIEVSPHPVLVPAIQETVDTVTGTLRRDDDSPLRFVTAVAEAYVRGVPVDWRSLVQPGDEPVQPLTLPTYPFQRERFWLRGAGGHGTHASGSQLGHPLLGATLGLAEGGSVVLTGRLSRAGEAWLADHRVGGRTVVPGTALLEMAMHAGDTVECQTVDELTLHAPLVLPDQGAVDVQVIVGAPDGDGRRVVSVHSRPSSDADLTPGVWACHATGGLLPESRPGPDATDRVWPPAGAVELPLDGFYDRLAGAGLAYGPLFRGLQRAWRNGDELYAEVAIAETAVDGFGIQPALLDAALHAVALAPAAVEGPVLLPFNFTGVRRFADSATALRVRLRLSDDGSIRLDATDPAGRAVIAMSGLALRPFEPGDVTTGRSGQQVYRVAWHPSTARTGTAPATCVLLTDPTGGLTGTAEAALRAAGLDVRHPGDDTTADVVVLPVGGDDPVTPDGVRTALTAVLRLIQARVADERQPVARFVVVTRHAVLTGEQKTVDPLGASVHGLVRSAQAEHPDNVLLADVDDDPASWAAVVRYAAGPGGEPEITVRSGTVTVPRLEPVAAPAGPATEWTGTVLVTGASGMLGTVVARHLVTAYGVRRLILLSRRGSAAPGAAELAAELTAAGCTVITEACDAADRDAVAAVLTRIPPEAPLTAVVHAAGALDDGVLASLDGDRLATVLTPKVTAALHLHELTENLELSALVLFSSAASRLGAPGQAGYAAANAFLDGLAEHRRSRGLPGTSVAWGFWAERSGLTGHLGGRDLQRLSTGGVEPLSTATGLALFDAALSAGEPAPLAVRFDRAALRGLAREGALPPLLSGLVPAGTRWAAAPATVSGSLTTLSATDRAAALAALVRSRVGAVLGHPDPSAVDPARTFKDLGFDSLTAVQMRNQLSQATGLRLPATLVFDHPTPQALAVHLDAQLSGESAHTPVAAVAAVDDDPIAIVGMACRLPGASTPDDFWQLLESGGEGITGFPTDRGWDVAQLAGLCAGGGFLHDAAGFDAGFFGISPREALAMDPQQRLLLEASWEAFEDAGIDALSLRGSDTGVFVGLMYHDYASSISRVPDGVEGYIGTGTSGSVVSGRVSYTFGFEGPAVTVDTACSSSLVAIHLAAQAVRSGECGLALAGGVTVMSSPALFAEFARQGGLARDGRSKSFAVAADGAGFSEGLGLVVLERLSVARERGHKVLALVLGSAVNQDGASNGLTAPNGPSQERVIRQALANAGVGPGDVDVVEAHGTGTALGDPIEAQALLGVFGRGRDRPLWLGSVKSNIGHTQAAAGVAGVIKVVLGLRYGVLPATLHVDEPTPHVDWSGGDVRLLTEARSWPGGGRRRRAGVSSFGISGTNAHIIIGESTDEPSAPAKTDQGPALTGSVPFVVSARGMTGLRAQAARLVVEADPVPLSVALAARAALPQRAVVVGDTAEELAAGLRALAGGQTTAAGVVVGDAGSGLTAWLLAGQGAQWTGMGLRLWEASSVFARSMNECEEGIAELAGWRLRDVLGDSAAMARVDVVQPASFAVAVSLARLWTAAGVRPDAVLGHSQGEIAAAHVAGILSLDDAVRVAVLRSRAIARIGGTGGMVAVSGVPVEIVTERIAPWGVQLAVAAVNGPTATVVSGTGVALAEFIAGCERDGLRIHRIAVDYGSHSAHVDPIESDVRGVLAGIAPGPAAVPMWSTVEGRWVDGPELDADYWWRNLRSQVRFADGVDALVALGVSRTIEVSPHPVLTPGVQDRVTTVLGTLRRDDDTPRRFLISAAEAYTAGVPVDWAALVPAVPPAQLPTYPFQRERYWLAGTGGGDLSGAGLQPANHPLVTALVPLADDGRTVLTGRISLSTHGWLGEHRVQGTALVPGTALVELALHVGDLLDHPEVAELTLSAPLTVADEVTLDLQVVSAVDGNRRTIRIHSCTAGSTGPWTLHAEGLLAPVAEPDDSHVDSAWPPPDAEPLALDGAYARLGEAGLDYGPLFQGLRSAWRSGADLYAEVSIPNPDVAGDFAVHPALLDAALHVLAADAVVGGNGTASILLPFSFTDVRLSAIGATTLRVRVSPVNGAEAGEGGAVRLEAADPDGRPVVRIGSLTLRPLTTSRVAAATDTPVPDSLAEALLLPEWAPVEVDTSVAPGSYAVITDTAPADTLTAGLGSIAYDAGNLDQLTEVPPVVMLPVDGTDPYGALTEVLTAVQRWLSDERFADSVLVIVTHRATPVGDTDVNIAGAAVWGLLRSVQAEAPGRCRIVDLADAVPDWPTVAAAVATDEPQLAVTKNSILAPRLAGSDLLVPPTGTTWRLHLPDGNEQSIDGVRLLPTPEAEAPLHPGQVRIAVRAAGLNFRDVLMTLGMYPGEISLGSEGAGIVVETAPDVEDLRPGDRVMGLLSGAFGPLAVADRRMLTTMPPGWSFQVGASVPIVFLTAWYGLRELAGLRSGERVLIHAAAGGVGMAATQIAQWLGAEVYATASESKWPVVEGRIPADWIANSRDTGFAERFRAAGGVDVVLNSLAGPFVDASLGLLRPGGRFIEMGKTDMRDPAEVARAYGGARYRAFDLMEAGLDRLQEMLVEIRDLLAAGVLQPLPVRAWDVRRAREALRILRDAKHTGKLVLTMPPTWRDGTVLVTGASGTLGGAVARHLARNGGARHLLLLSRQGGSASSAPALAADLADAGCQATFVACDAADRVALEAVLRDVRPELTAVVHAAGVLDDGVVSALTPQRLATVLRPKLDAARHLHELTRHLPLNAFVVYSSAAGTLCNPGQANYAAANAALDALVAHRHRLGLPATSLAWGQWADASTMTAKLDGRRAAAGMTPLRTAEGLALFDAAVGAGHPVVVPVKLDRRSRRRASTATTDPNELAGILARLNPTQRHEHLLTVVRGHTAAVLGHASPAAVEPARPFIEAGFDSLTAVELRNRLNLATGLRLPATLVFDHPSPLAVADLLRDRLCPQEKPIGVEAVLADLDRLEAGLAGQNDADTVRILDRVHALLSRQQGRDRTAADLGLGTASDEELFALVDTNGSSRHGQ
nr:type I polyketide synthase [Micromonospora tarapacensis]